MCVIGGAISDPALALPAATITVMPGWLIILWTACKSGPANELRTFSPINPQRRYACFSSLQNLCTYPSADAIVGGATG